MALIRIQERLGERDGSNAIVSIDHGPEYPIFINDPFNEQEEQEFEWYFEEYLKFPLIQKVRAQRAATNIRTYGEVLFRQVFGHPDIYAEYRGLLKTGLNDVRLEIAGSPKFHALHWEAMKDPNLAQPLALQATMVRKNLQPQTLPASFRPSSTINILIVTARPFGKHDVSYRTISRPLIESLRAAKLRVQVEIVRPGTYKALENHLRNIQNQYSVGYYHVIHFDMHGAVLTYDQFIQGQEVSRYTYNQRYGRSDIPVYEGVKAFLAFEDEKEDNKSDLVEASELANLLIAHHIPVTITNACQSGKQVGEKETSLGSYLIQAGVQFVLAMGYSATVSAAELLMSALYKQLFAHTDLSSAIRNARTELYNMRERKAYFDQNIDLEDWLLPIAYENQPLIMSVREFTLEESNAYFERRSEEERYTPPESPYGFIGRDFDILHIEKHLLSKHNILLMRGMSEVGKSTLLKYLRAWWNTTGFVKQVFYFDYHEKAWTLQQIMTEIAQQLYGQQYVTYFQPLTPKAQEGMLTKDLRSEHHLLILDNLEAFAGGSPAIQSTLPIEEQSLLRNFLVKLAKGNTFVLLGSRSGVDWLAKDTFNDNIYVLSGLDPEAISILTDRILKRNNVNTYRQDEDLQQLLKLLGGFPLAMEVVLANLASQTPVEVLQALQSGDMEICKEHTDKNTESSIGSSYSNLSTEAQQLLLCLALFTLVIDTSQPVFKNYTSQLCQQPALAVFPFERWPEVIQEAQDWGLLSPDPDVPRYLRLQPILSCFLRKRLHTAEQAEVKQAIEKAFREHFQQVGLQLDRLLTSQDVPDLQFGQFLTGLEYENLVTGLNLALGAQASVAGCGDALLHYLITIQDAQRGLALSQIILAHFEQYPVEKLAGSIGFEFVNTLGIMSNWLREFKQYSMAEMSSQLIIQLIPQLVQLDEKSRNILNARAYHQLGILKDEQREFPQAKQYYQQALEIYKECNDLQSQATIYHNMGVMAQAQRQFPQAEEYYRQALQLKDGSQSRAETYYQLGILAQDQRQLQQADQYYRQALKDFVPYSHRYACAYHQLGTVAQEQGQPLQAEQYYQHALKGFIMYKDYHKQAGTYHQLGRVAEEQQQYQQAREYFLLALKIYRFYGDMNSGAIVLLSFARLWKASGDTTLPATIAPILGISEQNTEELFRRATEDKNN